MSDDTERSNEQPDERQPERENVVPLCVNLQEIAQAIAEMLHAAAGKPIAFVLVASVGKAAQYVSNVDRKDGMHLLDTVLTAWKERRADLTPAHNKPDL